MKGNSWDISAFLRIFNWLEKQSGTCFDMKVDTALGPEPDSSQGSMF